MNSEQFLKKYYNDISIALTLSEYYRNNKKLWEDFKSVTIYYKLDDMCLKKEIPNNARFALHKLYNMISTINIINEINLPTPQIDYNIEATIDFIWFDQKNNKCLGFTILLDGKSVIWMHYLENNQAKDFYDPNENIIIEYMKKMANKMI